MGCKKNKKYYIKLLFFGVLFVLLNTSCDVMNKKTTVEKRLKRQNKVKKKKNCDCPDS